MIGIYDLPKFSINNRRDMALAPLAGCYYCCKTFSPKEITEYTDNGNTCVCPLCKVDAVVADNTNSITVDLLERAKKYWFSKSNTSSLRSQP